MTANAILGKVGGRAPDVILELIHSKCFRALLYGLEACPLLCENPISVR